jgi:hypothetical protein
MGETFFVLEPNDVHDVRTTERKVEPTESAHNHWSPSGQILSLGIWQKRFPLQPCGCQRITGLSDL